MSEIFYDHEGVIVSLDEPVELLIVMSARVAEGLLSFSPEILSPLLHVEVDGPEVCVLLGADEGELVAVGAPGPLDVYCLNDLSLDLKISG